LRRDPRAGVLGGVIAGLARHTGVDPVLLRVGFVLLVVVTGGLGLIAYAVAWALIPAGEGEGRVAGPRAVVPRIGPGSWKVAAGAGLLALAVLLVFRELGIWWSDGLVWPVVLAAAGAALLWWQSRSRQPRPTMVEPRLPEDRSGSAPEPRGTRAVPDLYRGGFGIALVLGAGLLFLSANDALGAARDVALTAVVAVIAIALILAPFLWRLGRNLAAERTERIRSQERAEVAAHLHDSVLQTLALVQRRASDPREVAALARRQERELRSWLSGGLSQPVGDSLVAALRAAAAEIEDAHGVVVEVVAVGDTPLDERGEALVAATREALANAAKFAPDSGPIAVYAEAEDGRAQVFVRDRGPGFDPDAVAPDRRGLRESIHARMERNGGRAAVRSSPGTGTEVELSIETGTRA
jgi:phage shock protein PspC (stress-responsive transcriptional regulator)/signal transduction histidine kinase